MRWIAPVVLSAATAWVAWTNATSADTRIVFTFLRPLLGPDPDVLARATVILLGTISAALVLSAGRDTFRRQREED